MVLQCDEGWLEQCGPEEAKQGDMEMGKKRLFILVSAWSRLKRRGALSAIKIGSSAEEVYGLSRVCAGRGSVGQALCLQDQMGCKPVSGCGKQGYVKS